MSVQYNGQPVETIQWDGDDIFTTITLHLQSYDDKFDSFNRKIKQFEAWVDNVEKLGNSKINIKIKTIRDKYNKSTLTSSITKDRYWVKYTTETSDEHYFDFSGTWQGYDMWGLNSIQSIDIDIDGRNVFSYTNNGYATEYLPSSGSALYLLNTIIQLPLIY